MQFFAVLFIVASVAGQVPAEDVDPAKQERLLQALSDLGAAPMTQEFEFLNSHVMQDEPDFSARVSAFETFFAKHPFTDHHATNLAAHITYGTADRERMARFSGAFAATAVRLYWEQAGAEGIVGSAPALLFLERLFVGGDETLNNACAAGINDALKTTPISLAASLDITQSTPEDYAEAMQCCISLGVFKKDRPVSEWLDISDRIAHFMDATGIWLFDNEALSEAHLALLQDVFKHVPQPLHNVVVLFVPEAVPFSAASSPLRLPGIALDIPKVSEDALRDLAMMPPYVAQPSLPEFTMRVLEQTMKAIVATTLPKRPDLMQRTAAVMRMAVALPDSPVAQLAPPDILLGAPDSFLAYLGTLWLANAEALLEAALVPAEQGNPAPLYAILLVADLFSRQDDTTLLFHATPTGTFKASETALRRIFVTPVMSYVNGIAVGGRLWHYDMSGIAAVR